MGWFSGLCNAVGSAISKAASVAVSVVSAPIKAVVYVAEKTYEVIKKVDEVVFGTPYKDEYNRLHKELQEQQKLQKTEMDNLESDYNDRIRRLDKSRSEAEQQLNEIQRRNKKVIDELESSIKEQKAANEKKFESLKKDHDSKMNDLKAENLKERKVLDEKFADEMNLLLKQNEEEMARKLKQIEIERQRMLAETANATKKLEEIVKERVEVIENHSSEMESLRERNYKMEDTEKSKLHDLKKKHLDAQRMYIKEVTGIQVEELNQQAQFLGITYEQNWGKRLVGNFDRMVEATLASHATIKDLVDNLAEIDEDNAEGSFAVEMSKELLKDHQEKSRSVEEASRFMRSQLVDYPDIDSTLKEVLSEAALTYSQNQHAIARIPYQLQLALKNEDYGKVDEIRETLEKHNLQLREIATAMHIVRSFDTETCLQIVQNPEMLQLKF